MGCASSAHSALASVVAGSKAGRAGRASGPAASGPRRLSLRPHSLETRILQVDQVDALRLEPTRSSEREEPFLDGQLGLKDLAPSDVALLPTDTPFVDPDFPADSGSLGGRQAAGLRWCRPSELEAPSAPSAPSGRVWAGECRGRVRAGLFDDRWLAEAMAVVAQRPQLLDKVFGVDAPMPGAVRVRLWRFGRWEAVVVDDRLPVPHGISSEADGEVWPAVLEKAFAKIHGGYLGLSGGDVLWGLEDLTGGLSQRLQPTPHLSPYVQVYRPLAQALRVGALISCMPVWNERNQHLASRQEIFVSTVVDTKLTIGGPQVCVHDEMGSHWMSLDEFVQTYTNVIITMLSTESEDLQVHESFGWWETGVSAGGSRNNLEKFATNPQYFLSIAQPDEHEDNKDLGQCTLLMALMQEHRRSAKSCRPPLLPIAYFIYKAEVPGERLTAEYFLCVSEEMGTGSFTNKREIAHQAELAPGDYIVIPALWSAGQQTGYLLRIFTLRKVMLKSLPPYKPIYAMLPTWVPATDT